MTFTVVVYLAGAGERYFGRRAPNAIQAVALVLQELEGDTWWRVPESNLMVRRESVLAVEAR